MTPEERAKELVKQDGGGDYYYEGWAQEDSIASAIRAAEDEALERAAHEFETMPCPRPWAASVVRSLKSKGSTDGRS